MKTRVNIILIGILVLALANSCKFPPKKSDDDITAFLKEKFRESPFAKDTFRYIRYNVDSLKYIATVNDMHYCVLIGTNEIFRYNPNKNYWTTREPGYDDPNAPSVSSLRDYRLMGKRLYCMYDTGACGGTGWMVDIAFYCFDLDGEIWQFLTHSTACGGFSGDTIVANIAWFEKEVYYEDTDSIFAGRLNYDECVYGDSIKLIKME